MNVFQSSTAESKGYTLIANGQQKKDDNATPIQTAGKLAIDAATAVSAAVMTGFKLVQSSIIEQQNSSQSPPYRYTKGVRADQLGKESDNGVVGYFNDVVEYFTAPTGRRIDKAKWQE